MECVECKSKLVISKTGYRAENDDTPDTPTKVVCFQELACLKADCSMNGKVIDVIEHEIQLN